MYNERILDDMLLSPKNANADSSDLITQHLNYLYFGDYRRSELEYTNKIFTSQASGRRFNFQIGRIYAFNYAYMNDGKMRNYIDIRPMIFVTDIMKDGIVKGFNLNFLSKKAKLEFIQIYYLIFKRILHQDIRNIENDNLTIYNYRPEEIDIFQDQVHKYLPKLSNSIRYWDTKRIHTKTVDVIRPQDYNIIYDYTGFKKTIQGKSWAEIQTFI